MFFISNSSIWLFKNSFHVSVAVAHLFMHVVHLITGFFDNINYSYLNSQVVPPSGPSSSLVVSSILSLGNGLGEGLLFVCHTEF